MKKPKSIPSAVVVIAVSTACGRNNGDNPTICPNPNPDNKDFHEVVLATGITNPEGNSGNVYLQTLPNSLPGIYGNNNSIPYGFGSAPTVTESGDVYAFPDCMGNTETEINHYRIINDGTWKKEGVLSIPAGATACNIVEVSDERACLSLQGTGTMMVSNPATMTKIADIDLSSLKQTDTRVAPAAMIICDGKLFVGLNRVNAQYVPTRNNIELAIINMKTDKVERHITNTTLGLCFAARPIDPGSTFMDENEGIYTNCIGSFDFILGLNGDIVHIEGGSTDIDPDYYVWFDRTEVVGLATKYANFLSTIFYADNEKAYAYANPFSLDPNGLKSPYVSLTNVPVVIDLKQKMVIVVKGMEISNPQGVVTGKRKNLVVFGNASKKADGFYTYNPGTKGVVGPVVQVKGNSSFFHSFEK